METNFAIIGAAGYIAPRHLAAMKALGCNLTAAHDLSDSVGIIDRYFPDACFTTDPKEFRKLLTPNRTNYLTVCTPNYLHGTHTVMGLEAGMDVICEKPLALAPDELRKMELAQYAGGGKVHPILQLRLHPEIIRLKHFVEQGSPDTCHDIELTYITPRGNWYAASWKGDAAKSGGVVTNIGIHFIDMLHWIFGPAETTTVHYAAPDCAAGFLRLKRARVRYFLSVNPAHRPSPANDPMSSFRSMSIDGRQFDFSNGFTDLHTLSYRRIIDGEGFSIADAAAAIATLETIRRTNAVGPKGDYHPLLRKI